MFKLVQSYASRDEQEWGPLFHRILQSRIRDFYRRSVVRNRFRVWFGNSNHDDEDDDPLQNQADQNGSGPLQELESERFGDELEHAISELPNRQQQAFLLRAWEGMSVNETAKAMSCSEGSVKSHYSRAINSLRGKLEDFNL